MYSVSIRNIENSAVPMMNITMLAAASVCSRKIENGISGCVVRDSWTTNPTSRTAATAKTPIVRPDVQPQS